MGSPADAVYCGYKVSSTITRSTSAATNLLLGRSLASIGCIITVVSLTLDPFAQQVLVYQTRHVPIGEAWVRRTWKHGDWSITCQYMYSRPSSLSYTLISTSEFY